MPLLQPLALPGVVDYLGKKGSLARAEADNAEIDAAIDRRGKLLREFYLNSALGVDCADGGNAGEDETKEMLAVWPERPRVGESVGENGPLGAAVSDFPDSSSAVSSPVFRQPEGSGYLYPTWRAGELVKISDRFCEGLKVENEDIGNTPSQPFCRSERIRMLEQGMRMHDTTRCLEIAEGTHPLQWPDGTRCLPVPPPEPREKNRLLLHHRLHLTSANQNRKQAIKDLLMATAIFGNDATDRPGALETAEELGRLGSPRWRLQKQPMGSQEVGIPSRRMQLTLAVDASELLRTAEELLGKSSSEDRWCRLGAELGGKTYDLDIASVLRAVKLFSSVSSSGNFKVSIKQELLRVAGTMLHSVSARMSKEPLPVILDVVKTVAESRIGTQPLLDMLMSLALARHHRDCQVLGASECFQLAKSLGRIARIPGLRLRPQGLGGPQTSTNRKLLSILEERLSKYVPQCSVEQFLQLDAYYVSRICDYPFSRIVVTWMACLHFGMRESTQQHVRWATEFEETMRRELPESFRWSLNRGVRDYLERLRLLRLKKDAPWTLGEAEWGFPCRN